MKKTISVDYGRSTVKSISGFMSKELDEAGPVPAEDQKTSIIQKSEIKEKENKIDNLINDL